MEQVPTNNNLAEIINQTISSVQQLSSGYVKLLNIINGSVDKIAGVKINTQALSKLKQANDFVSAYSASLGAVIQSVLGSNKELLKDSSVVDLLGYVTETSKDFEGNVTTKGKFILLDGLVAFSSVLSNMSKMLESLTKADYGKNLIRAKLNITLFIDNTKDLIGYMVNQLQELNKIDASNLLGDESVVEKLYKTEESIDKNKTSLQESEKTTVKTFGVLDVLEKYLTIVKLVNDLKVPNPVKVMVQVKLFNISLRIILSSIKSIADTYGTKEFMLSLSNLSNSFSNISKVVESLEELVDDLGEICKVLIVQSPLINIALSKLYKENKYVAGVGEGGILTTLSSLLYSREFLILSGYDKKTISSAEAVVSSLLELTETLAQFGNIKTLIGILIVNIVLNRVSITFTTFLKLIESIPEVPDDATNKITVLSECVSSVKSLVDALLSISKGLILLSLVALPATIGLILSILFVKQLIVFIRWVSFISRVLQDKDYEDTKNKIDQIRSVVFSLLLVGTALILLAVTAVVTIPAAFISISMIIVIGLVLIAIRTLLLVYEMIDGRGTGSTKLVMSILSIAAIIGLMSVITLELVALSHVYKLLDWKGLFLGLGLFVIAMAAVIGVGALMFISTGVLLGFIAVAGIALGIMLFTITSMILISLELILFSKLDLSPLVEEKDGHNKIELQMMTIVNTITTVSNQIWKAYKDGKGILATSIIAVWLTINIFTIGAMILITGALMVLNKIAINLDETEVSESVTKIMNLSHHVIDMAIGSKGRYTKTEDGKAEPNPQDVSFIDRLISIGGGMLEVVKSLLAFVNLATVALSVAVLWGIAAMLKKIPEIANELDEGTVIVAVNKIILCANSVHQSVLSGGNAKTKEEAKDEGILSKAGRFLKGGVKALGGAIGNVVSAGVIGTAMVAVGEVELLATMLNKINDFNVNEDDIVRRVDQIIRLSDIVSTNASDKTDALHTLNTDKVKSFGLYVDDSVKLMKQINKLDSNKVVKYTDMWVKMSEFMDKMQNLNIEELADAIVNRIAPAMEGISDNVDKIGSNTSKPNIAVNPAATVPNTIQPTSTTTKLPPEKPKDYTEQVERIARLLEEILETRQ